MNRKTLIWLIISLVVPVLALLIARQVFGGNEAELSRLLSGFSETAYAWPLTIFLFCVLAFVGAPQWLLLTAAIVAFGPWEGSAVSWVGSLVSASLGFGLGRIAGAQRLEKIDARLIKTLSDAVRKNGFMTSLVIRLVPTGPAILVNLAAGVSPMKFSHFLSGTAVGILPKIIVIALISQGVISGLSGSMMSVGFAGLAGLVLGLSWLARKRLSARSPLSGEK